MINRYALCITIVCSLYGTSIEAGALLSGMGVTAGERGLAIVLETDQPAVKSYRTVIHGNETTLRIKLTDAVYALDAFEYTDFPASGPVRKIKAYDENKGVLYIEAVIRAPLSDKTSAKRVGKRNMFLLSRKPFARYHWEASPRLAGTQSGQTTALEPAPASAEPAVIVSVSFIKRGAVEQLVVKTDKPARVRTQRKGTILLAVFENTINGLTDESYAVPAGSLFRDVTLKESDRDGVARVGIRVQSRNASVRSALVETKNGSYAFVAVMQESLNNGQLALWSHEGGTVSVEEFRKAQALTAIPAPSPPEKPTPAPARNKRLVIIRDMVNLRSAPTTGAEGAIIRPLRLGAKATGMREQGAWNFVRVDDGGEEGWIYRSMAAESTLVTEAQWKAIVSVQATVHSAIPAAQPEPPGPVGAQVPQATPEPVKRVTRYREYGRDPFLPLNQGDFLEYELVQVQNCNLVGILYDPVNPVAVVEDRSKNGVAYSLHEKDAVHRGRVLKITEDEVVFLINEAGFSRRFNLRMNTKP